MSTSPAPHKPNRAVMARTISAQAARKDILERIKKANIKVDRVATKLVSFESLGYGTHRFVEIIDSEIPQAWFKQVKEDIRKELGRSSEGGYVLSLRRCSIRTEEGHVFKPLCS